MPRNACRWCCLFGHVLRVSQSKSSFIPRYLEGLHEAAKQGERGKPRPAVKRKALVHPWLGVPSASQDNKPVNDPSSAVRPTPNIGKEQAEGPGRSSAIMQASNSRWD